jgi:type III restriction enzyme
LISLHYKDEDGNPKFQYFPELIEIVRFWLENKVRCLGDAFVNMLFHFDESEYCHHIMQGIQSESRNTDRILPVLNPYNRFGTTGDVHAVTRRKNKPYATEKSHVNYVVADTGKWEQVAAKSMEEMGEVISYVKNQFLDFAIPYVYKGMKDRLYYPDFIARCKGGSGETINLIIEVTGMNQDKEDKKWYVENRWLPAVNSIRDQYGFDRWAFIEISGDIRDIKNDLRKKIRSL